MDIPCFPLNLRLLKKSWVNTYKLQIIFPYTTLFQNHVYAVGGNDGVASLSSVEKYDPHLDKWIEVKEMGQRRAGNGVSELHGCLYVVGE